MADRKVLFRSGANLNEASPSADQVRAIGVKSDAATVTITTTSGSNFAVDASNATVSSAINLVPAADSNAELGATGARWSNSYADKTVTEEIEDTLGSLVIDSNSTGTSTISLTNEGSGGVVNVTVGDDDANNDLFTVYGDVQIGGSTQRNLTVKGNLVVEGSTTSVGGENTLIADNYQVLNSGYTSDAAQTVGHVFNIDPAATSFSISTIATNVITVASGDPSAVLSAGDFIIIAGANTASNDGIYEVGSVTTTTITIDTTPAESFSQSSITDDATAAGTVVGTSITVLRSNTTGDIQKAFGSTAGLTYNTLATGTVTLDDAYTNGNTITRDATGAVIINGDSTTTGTFLDLNPNVLANTSPIVDITYAAGAYTGTPFSLKVDYSGTTSITNAGDFSAINLLGKTNAGGGDSIAISIDTGFDQGIENASTLVQSGTATFSGNVASSGSGTFDWGSSGAVTATGNPTFNFGTSQADFGGNIDATAGVDIDADSVSLTIGAGGDFSVLHNGTNTVATSATGSFILDNTNTTGATVMQLGTDTNATAFQVKNDTGTVNFSVDGAGDITLGGAATDVVNFTADLGTDLIPTGNNAQDLGASGSSFAEIWMQGANLNSSAATDGASVIGYDPSSNNQTASTNVAAALDDLGSAIDAAEAQTTITFTDSGSGIAAGAAVRIAGNDTVTEAIATSEAAAAVVGVAESAIGTSATGEITTGHGSLIENMKMVNGLTPTANDAVYLSATSGLGTTTAPSTSGQVVKKIGTIKDASAYVTVTNPFVEMVFQPEPATLIA